MHEFVINYIIIHITNDCLKLTEYENNYLIIDLSINT